MYVRCRRFSCAEVEVPKWFCDKGHLIGTPSLIPWLLFCAGSIEDNIAYGRYGRCGREEVETAARAANAHDFIMELPEQCADFATICTSIHHVVKCEMRPLALGNAHDRTTVNWIEIRNRKR